jgi:putative Holliday junction resolvase
MSAAQQGTVLAFDFGLKRIGVAVGNTLMQQAQPLSIIDAVSNDAKFAAIEKLMKEWQPQVCIVGLPMHPDGEPHAMTARCQRFAHQLEGRFGVATVLVDERYTSAVLHAKQGERIDDQAATLILQQYFDQA